MSGRTKSVSPLALVLPHPTLPRSRSSRLSAAPSPRTPRNCGSPTCSTGYFTPANRKSTDSWNSSNYDFGDEEGEWKAEQVILLQRTLDALPSHLVTPFNGPIPPPNLLDKIARGVSQAKGPNDWPHSLRATRVKLMELAKARASDDSDPRRKAVNDENDDSSCYTDIDPALGLGKKALSMRRPLYRQSSMDFLGPSVSANESASIASLSNRLQRADRSIPSQTYHPYNRMTRSQTRAQTSNRRSSSPMTVPSLTGASNTSSSTLTSLSSSVGIGPRPYFHRSSTLSSISTNSLQRSSLSTELSIDEIDECQLMESAMPRPPDFVPQRIRRAESFCGPSPSSTVPTFLTPSDTPRRQGVKRAPSFGTLAQEAKGRGEPYAYGLATTGVRYSVDASSDEEEKTRARSAKKLRTKSANSPPSPTGKVGATKSKEATSPRASSKADSPSRSKKLSMKHNASLLDKELPLLPHQLGRPTLQDAMLVTPVGSPKVSSNILPASPISPIHALSRPVKTLRRVKRMAPGRRISFGNLVDAQGNGHEADIEGDADEKDGLGSAFQLR